MNTKNLIVSSLIGGAVIAAISNIPVINLINCLLCIGYWGGAILAVWLYKRFENTLTLGQGVAVGALAGVWAGLINFVVGLVSLAGIGAALSAVEQVLPPDSLGLESGFIESMALLINVLMIFLAIFLGALGGLIGGAIFQTKPEDKLTLEPVTAEPIPPPAGEPMVVEIVEEDALEVEDVEEPPSESD
jgi:hypothetical protein